MRSRKPTPYSLSDSRTHESGLRYKFLSTANHARPFFSSRGLGPLSRVRNHPRKSPRHTSHPSRLLSFPITPKPHTLTCPHQCASSLHQASSAIILSSTPSPSPQPSTSPQCRQPRLPTSPPAPPPLIPPQAQRPFQPVLTHPATRHSLTQPKISADPTNPKTKISTPPPAS